MWNEAVRGLIWDTISVFASIWKATKALCQDNVVPTKIRTRLLQNVNRSIIVWLIFFGYLSYRSFLLRRNFIDEDDTLFEIRCGENEVRKWTISFVTDKTVCLLHDESVQWNRVSLSPWLPSLSLRSFRLWNADNSRTGLTFMLLGVTRSLLSFIFICKNCGLFANKFCKNLAY
jgi:hypothetical protein